MIRDRTRPGYDLPPEVKFRRVHPDARLPRYASAKASGMDLEAVGHHTASPGKYIVVPTGWEIELPPGYEGQIRPRSGLAAKQGVTVLNSPGTIDNDYRGEILVILINHGSKDRVFAPGDRIAQLVVVPVAKADIKEVSVLSPTPEVREDLDRLGRRRCSWRSEISCGS